MPAKEKTPLSVTWATREVCLESSGKQQEEPRNWPGDVRLAFQKTQQWSGVLKEEALAMWARHAVGEIIVKGDITCGNAGLWRDIESLESCENFNLTTV